MFILKLKFAWFGFYFVGAVLYIGGIFDPIVDSVLHNKPWLGWQILFLIKLVHQKLKGTLKRAQVLPWKTILMCLKALLGSV